MSNMSVALVDATFSMDDFSIGGDIADFDFDLDKVFDDYDPEILNSHLTASLDTKMISSSSLSIGSSSSSSSSDESSLTGVSSIEDDVSDPSIKTGDERKRKASDQLVLRKRKGPAPKNRGSAQPLQSGKAPNMSRRGKHSALVAFPSFDKCDSLVYFPHSMSRFLNTGDFTAFEKLLSTHLDKSCHIMVKNVLLSRPSLVKLFEIANEVHPDTVCCVHQTQVDGNTISSSLYSKFTDCKSIYESVQRRIHGEEYGCLMSGTRGSHLRAKLDIERREEEEQKRLGYLVDSDGDLTIYSTMQLTMKVDNLTRKVTSMEYSFQITSMQPANWAIGSGRI